MVIYALFIGLIGLERLFELWLSRRNARALFALGAVEAGGEQLKWMSLMHGAFLVSCVLEAWLLRRFFPGALGYLALGAAALAQGLRYWAVATLGPRWNVRVIVVPNQPPITNGPYRFVRHPNYLAVVIEVLAVPLVHGAWLTALSFSLLNALVLRARIRLEERALGPSYQAAFACLPRFLPGARDA